LVDASRRGDVSEISKLLAEGAKPDQPDPLTRKLPLDVAAEEGHGDAVSALLKAGASVAAPKHLSPLLRVVGAMESKARSKRLDPETTERYLGIVKQLLAAGCKPNARFFGFDALSVAQSIKCQQLVELLEAAIPLKPPGKKKK